MTDAIVMVSNVIQTVVTSDDNVATIAVPQIDVVTVGIAGADAPAITVKNESNTLTTSMTSIDFVGAGVNATNTGGAVTVTISGSGLSDGDYGDITVGGSGTTMAIDNGAVTLLKTSAGVQASLAFADSSVQPADLADYVPYTGATGDVDLGANHMNAEGFSVTGTGGNGHIHLKHQSANAAATGSSTVLFANSSGDIKYKNDGGYYTTFVTSANTADRAYTFPDQSGDVALKGTLTANRIAFTSDSNTVGSLNTAIYPSLAELSYAKGVTSAIQTQLDGKVDENSAITGATKTKITYDAKGLVTGGADATTADIADSSNKRYVTDAQLIVIGNTSGTNTGDQDLSPYLTSATAASTYQPLSSILTNTTASFTTADETKLDGLTQYTDEMAQDAVGAMIDSSLSYVDGTPLLQRAALTGEATASAGSNSVTLTNSAVIGKVLTGFTSGAGTVAATDTILQAFQKIVGNIATLVTGISSVFGRTGAVTAQSGDYNTSQVTENTNLYFTDERAQDAVGGILVDSSEIDFTYNDATPSITASIVASSIDESKLDASVNASLDLADSAAQNSFTTIAVSGQSNVVADSATDTLTLVAGSNITITTDAATDAITIASSGGGGGAPAGAEYVTLSTNGSLTHERVLTAGTGITITDAGAGSTVTVATTITQYTDEMAQDAVGAMVDSTLVYVDGTPLLTRAALTGDITAAQASNATTLATVNSDVGSFGSATQVAAFTVNAKGLVTAASNTAIQIAESQVTNLTADLAAKAATATTITIAGTSNQVISSAGAQDLSANRTWTLSLPQNIHTAATPQFGYMGLGSASVSTQGLTTVLATATDKGHVIKAAASQTANLAEFQDSSGTAFLTVGAPTLAGDSSTKNFLNLTATMPATMTAAANAINISVTGAGSSSFNNRIANLAYNAGYTGSSATRVFNMTNSNAGTGATYAAASASASYRFSNNNGVITGVMTASTTGVNFGCEFAANGSSTANYGSWFSATSSLNTPALNVGLVSTALNATTNCAGFFGLYNGGTSAPTFSNSALIADNGSTAGDIFVARDNGTAVMTIADGGATTFASQYSSTRTTCTTTLDWNNGNCQTITLANGGQTFTFANPIAGGRYLLELKQPSSGAAGTVTWPSTVKWSGGTAPTLTATNGQTDIITFYYNGTNYAAAANLDYGL